MIPSGSQFLPVSASFSATFGAVTAGQYDFGVAANRAVPLLNLYAERLYCIRIMNNSADVPESAFVENILTVPQILFGLKLSNPLVFGQPYPLPIYLSNNEINAFFRTNSDGDVLQATVTGTLGQNASLVGYDPIKLSVALNVFMITDKKFLAGFYEETGLDKGLVDIPAELRDRI
jgi:hypothetical protein